ncbi:filamentous hemagglutinin N-terminal domain-containing protein [Waterburya agarophytonicola K14]|uniref:Filamentous hemagglutinin N-terminal domain-containing protein n=1 Tax=Waterburya agarophytonicola KI4 TaxID=2874699 RepID=A0A964BME0_9CYAN|nr:filamentous hemagglutinin N-terminal domain-containing protein [Waterburya agarophytonicola]MCC0175995.1 filamentous hemagglutinin N-terminal domain-containing protein [Waterburya agarophytonicola KI4]
MPEKLPIKPTNHHNSQKSSLDGKLSICLATLLYGGFSLLFCLSRGDLVQAQIVPDDTVSTEVNNSDNIAEITGGTTQGGNLFHSFQEFSVDTGNTAYFNNLGEIDNIIGRVTGSSISTIDGFLRANGDANLILINPNGIDFGANARLQIGGSFLGSTADSVIFEDGTVFSAGDLTVSPLLTVRVPVGLQLGQNSGAINVAGVGHDLSLDIPIFFPFNRGQVSGLKLQSGGTLGLVGGDVSFTGGVLISEQGRIELGSVAEGTVSIAFGERDFSLSYEGVESFKNINLEERALVDASGNNSGSIAIQGNRIAIADGSAVLIQNQGTEASGNLKVNAREFLTVDGIAEDGIISTGIYTEPLGDGAGGNITIDTPNLEVSGGAKILSTTYTQAPSGNLKLNIADSLRVIGFAEINPNQFSLISAQTYNTGDAGEIDITTQNLTALDGGNIASVTATPNGTGSGGNVTVNARESILLSGFNPIAFAPSQITAGSGGVGNAGNVELNTKNLTLIEGGRVDASATATGDAGNVTINASESIMVTGTVPNSLNPSLIIASANILDPALRELFNLPPTPSANSGNVIIETPQLEIMNGGQVTVRNDGTGNAGNLNINANTIALRDGGGITAAVKEGLGGTINLEVADSFTLTRGSQISSDNSGTGDGGEIEIAANSLDISDRSFITTTTFGSGRGGNIVLNILDQVNITGIGFREFQEAFQANSLNGNLTPGTRGTGIFLGTAAEGIGGNLEVNANALNIAEGGIIFSPIFTNGTGGEIQVNANDITIDASALQIGAGVDSTSLATAGNIFINTDRLIVENGGTIVNATFGEATGGNINIDARESINLRNTPSGSRLFTGIYANTSIGEGKGGNVTLRTDNLSIEDAFVSSTTGGFINDDANLTFSGGGDGGNINIDVADTIEILGIPTDPRFASGINSSSFTNGAAGNIQVSARKLFIRDGSEIAATTLGSGNGGSVNINVLDSLELFGTTTINNMKRGGIITTSGRSAFPDLVASGASGDIRIDTGNLKIQNGASIDVQSLGTGSAGNLNIESANDILLDDEGIISAANNFGNGGNIDILGRNIFWRGNSTTTATATGNANGGNINLVGTNLVVLESSKLTAEAENGTGGNIDISAKGLFVCQECIISASSRLGVDGVVEIDTLEPEATFGIVEVPIKLTQPEETVARACSNSTLANNSKLTVTGRGGLPNSPRETLSSKSIVSFDIPQANTETRTEEEPKKQALLPSPARNWYQNSKGEIILTSQPSDNTPRFNSPDCHVP